jgi:NADPH:quinone reductase-like Zn-dependent oxidoreductase
MKAAYIDQYGDVGQVVELGDVPRPEVQPDDVLVEIYAAGVNPVDWKIVEGHLRTARPMDFPAKLGYDMAGVVVDKGCEVSGFKVGDAVFSRVDPKRPGTFAEYVAVSEKLVAPKPENLNFAQAAAVPLAALTAWQALFENIRLEKGQKVLIHAGLGGVGSFAIQFAKHAGAEVATTVGTAHVEQARALGADRVIDYRQERFEEVLHDFDAVLDTLAGEVQSRSLAVLKPGGVLASTLGISTEKPGIRFEAVMVHSDGAQLAEIGRLIESGAVRPVIDRTFPLDRVKEALLYSRGGHATGKIVIQVKPG